MVEALRMLWSILYEPFLIIRLGAGSLQLYCKMNEIDISKISWTASFQSISRL